MSHSLPSPETRNDRKCFLFLFKSMALIYQFRPKYIQSSPPSSDATPLDWQDENGNCVRHIYNSPIDLSRLFFHRLRKYKILWPVHQRSFLSIRHPIDPLFLRVSDAVGENKSCKITLEHVKHFYFARFFPLVLRPQIAFGGGGRKR